MKIMRRNLLCMSALSLFSSFKLSDYFGHSSSDTRRESDSLYLVEFATYFSGRKTYDQYIQDRSSYANIAQSDTVIEKFKADGKMLQTASSFRETSNHWFVLFDCKASYLEWCSIANQNNIYSQTGHRQKGFRRVNRGKYVSKNVDILKESSPRLVLAASLFPTLWRS